jgi:peptide/nickel transport system permease protein
MSVPVEASVPADTAESAFAFAREERVFVASQWQLMWWRFRKHRAAIASTAIILVLYAVGLLCEFLAPYDPFTYAIGYTYAPPQQVHFRDENGFHLRPFVYALVGQRDPSTLEVTYRIDPRVKYSIYFFVRGEAYKLWGIFPSDLHLFGIRDPERMLYLFGSDRMGRDILSRVLYGARVSLSVGLVGVALSLTLGVLIGGVSGYFGGVVDDIIQRIIEFLISMPSIPLWMALSAALPSDWPVMRVYFGITIILSLISWTWLARVVRGRFLSLREEDFIMAAKLSGSSELRIITRHMVPSFLSHLIASITLSIANMIIGETSLSFLGLGLRPPVISWGVLLQEAQNVQAVVLAPWLFVPGLFVVLAVLAFNFAGDGLRDAADPYAA